MKKVPVFLVTAIYSSYVFAVNGPYVGIGIGYSDTVFDVHHYGTVSIAPGQSSKSFQGIANGIQGQLAIGYIYDINKFRLGAEITAWLPKVTNSSYSTSDNSFDYEFTSAYSINFVPGYYITDRNSIYLKIGAARGKFAYRNITNTKVSILDTSFYTTGLNLGVGTEMYLTRNIKLKLEYTHTNYATQKFTTTLTEPENMVVNIDSKIQPQTHMFMLGMNYQFDLF